MDEPFRGGIREARRRYGGLGKVPPAYWRGLCDAIKGVGL